MTSPSWAIPVGTLSGICVLMLGFICWWFPRTWARGTQQELEIIQQRIDAKKRAAELQEAEGGDLEQGVTHVDGLTQPPKVFIYNPPPVATY